MSSGTRLHRYQGGLLRAIGRAAVLMAATSVASLAHAALVIDYPDFSSVAGLTINGDAAQVGSVLRVTPATFSQAGSAFSTSEVALSSGASFSTYFRFRFTSPGGSCDSFGGCGADGVVFAVQTVSNSVGGAGGGIGYLGIANSVGIEFDNWFNAGIDINSNHVGVDLNGSVASVASINIAEEDLNEGDIWNAWVDYNSVTELLEVRLTRSAARPVSALLSYSVDLASVLGDTDAFVGFTSGTGAAFANHDILSWQLRDSFDPITPVPEPAGIALLAFGLAGVAALRRRRP